MLLRSSWGNFSHLLDYLLALENRSQVGEAQVFEDRFDAESCVEVVVVRCRGLVLVNTHLEVVAESLRSKLALRRLPSIKSIACENARHLYNVIQLTLPVDVLLRTRRQLLQLDWGLATMEHAEASAKSYSDPCQLASVAWETSFGPTCSTRLENSPMKRLTPNWCLMTHSGTLREGSKGKLVFRPWTGLDSNLHLSTLAMAVWILRYAKSLFLQTW